MTTANKEIPCILVVFFQSKYACFMKALGESKQRAIKQRQLGKISTSSTHFAAEAAIVAKMLFWQSKFNLDGAEVVSST